MKKQEKSPQFLRTDKAIIDAMIRLLNEHTFDEITVQDILDEAMISRGTFYAHYADKYELVENMLDEYLKLHDSAPEQFRKIYKKDYPMLSKRIMASSYELVNALLKIHTDKVDLRSTLFKQMEQEYLSKLNRPLSPTAKDEASVYAATMVALQMTFINHVFTNDIDSDYVDRLVLSALLRILNLDGDQETLDFIQNKLDEMEKNRIV